jgi:hypothetical protein
VCGLVLFLLGLFYPFHLLNINICGSPACSRPRKSDDWSIAPVAGVQNPGTEAHSSMVCNENNNV